MKGRATLVLKKAETYSFPISLEVEGLMSGMIKGHAKPRSRDSLDKLRKDIGDKVFKDDHEVIREIYTALEGVPAFTKFDHENNPVVINGEPQYADNFGEVLTGEDAFREATKGHYNTWIIPQLLNAYFESFDASRAKNSSPLRVR